jgi:PAS domain S-box-containing protein
MKRLTTEVLHRSSDAIIVIRLEDGLVVDVNEAFFALTGYLGEELVGRDSDELLIWVTAVSRTQAGGGLRDLGSVSNLPVGFRTRAGELRVGHLSTLMIELDGRGHALCAVHDSRDPLPAERRSIVQYGLWRILGSGRSWLDMAQDALQTVGEGLRWELGVVWQVDPVVGALRCAHVWSSPLGCLEQLGTARRAMSFQPGEALLGRSWLSGETAWVPDVLAAPDVPRTRGDGHPTAHGWFAVPVAADGDVLGMLEFVSREIRQPDKSVLEIMNHFGSRLGRVAVGTVAAAPGANEAAMNGPGAADAGKVLELQRDPLAQSGSPALLRELATSIGRLNRLLEGVIDVDRPGRATAGPGPADAQVAVASGDAHARLRPPAGLTLKGVSERTGIPGATVRTWERRYSFIRPTRSASGYRLYGEEDVTRILQVKDLLEQGVRISEAMAAVRGTARQRPTG